MQSKLVGKVENKKLKRLFQSDIANSLAENEQPMQKKNL